MSQTGLGLYGPRGAQIMLVVRELHVRPNSSLGPRNLHRRGAIRVPCFPLSACRELCTHQRGKNKKINLADITLGFRRRRVRQRDPLVLNGELIGGVNPPIAGPAQRRLVSTAEDTGLGRLTHVTMNLHGL
ncbi:cyclin/Brf1-like TBP-binding protein [Striga asiatica]|uniref:Cyclin/Brf1-like TBP-binding protein n=1 Tax=Striga asiatica TaxID=4170 RepID=A0A5A7PM16_STRAF|nr:cyclin/Brf1-like TBP-binding protein [Striga asiatica]